MYSIMVNGKIVKMTNNAGVARTHFHSALSMLYPDADIARAMDIFRHQSVTVGCVAGLVTGK